VRRAFQVRHRIAQGKISLERFPVLEQGRDPFRQGDLRAGRRPTARLASLKSGQLDFIERVNPSDMPALKGDPR
jgi:hypothetical protein